MALNFDPGAADGALLARLRTEEGVQALAAQDENNGVHWAIAAYGNDPPHVVVSVASDNTTDYLNGQQQRITVSYLVRICGQTVADANALAKAVDVALQRYALSVAGFTTIALTRSGGGQRYVDGDGFYNVATYYRLELQGT